MRSDLDEAHYSTTWIADRALERLEGWGKGGSMMMVGFVKPHHPFDPPAPWDEMYDPERLKLLPGWIESCLPKDLAFRRGYFANERLAEGQLRLAMAMYYATLSQIDRHVGRMVDCLKRKGIYDRTLIVYTSDHGDYLGYHHLLLKGNYMYDPLVKVPLIVKYPDGQRAGQRSEALVSNVDLAPTLLRCTGCEVPSSMQGLDLTEREGERNVVVAEAGGGAAYMARSRTGKLLLCREPAQSQFFDLERDPLEMHDRIDDPAFALPVAELRAALMEWALFQAPSRVHQDSGAPVIVGANVSLRGDGHAERSARYFERRMQEPYDWGRS
jgi:arylsulfatase A-like enzyme